MDCPVCTQRCEIEGCLNRRHWPTAAGQVCGVHKMALHLEVIR